MHPKMHNYFHFFFPPMIIYLIHILVQLQICYRLLWKAMFVANAQNNKFERKNLKFIKLGALPPSPTSKCPEDTFAYLFIIL